MKIETRNLKSVKFNDIKGIKRKLKFGTLLLTTGIVLLFSNKVEAKEKDFPKNEIGILIDNTLIDQLEEKKEQIKKEYELKKKKEQKIDVALQYIDKYCNVYNLDTYKVEYTIGENTNLFSDNILNKDEKELEREILDLIRDIKLNPDNYSISIEDIADERYSKTKTIKEIVEHYSDLYNVDSNLILAIECFESGYYKCDIASKKNNPGSLRGSGDFYSYENIEQGIIAHIVILKRNYIDEGLDTPDKMQHKYCPDGSAWAKNVNYIYNQLIEDKNSIILYDEQKEIVKEVRK